MRHAGNNWSAAREYWDGTVRRVFGKFGIGILNALFYGRSYIAAPAGLSIPVLLDALSLL
jgi:hypothetical protein